VKVVVEAVSRFQLIRYKNTPIYEKEVYVYHFIVYRLNCSRRKRVINVIYHR